MRRTLLTICAVLLACSHDARADIYRYVNEDGVECFTDAPTGGGATIVLKDARRNRPAARRSIPNHMAAALGVEKPASRPAPVTAAATETTPFLPVAGRITSLAGLRHDPIDGTLRNHNGVDIAIPSGTPVRPAAAGTVVYSGWRPGYGNTVIIEHADGMLTLYAHNSTNLKQAGEQVERSTPVALSGSTGRSTGPHLHFEAWKEGVNLTATFFPAATGIRTVPHDLQRTDDGIRRIIQADGTLLFTNLR